MIALLIVGCIIFGTSLGWYGHKASLRIQQWGVKMNEQDHILEDLTDPEEAFEFQRGYGLIASVGNRLPLVAATK